MPQWHLVSERWMIGAAVKTVWFQALTKVCKTKDTENKKFILNWFESMVVWDKTLSQTAGRCSVPFVAQWLEWSVVFRFPLSSLKDGWNWHLEGCHLFATAEVPLSKAPYPHAPRRCEWLPTAPVYSICLYECVTLCMCVLNRCQPGWVKSRGQISCIPVHDNKSDLNLYTACKIIKTE